MAKHFTKRHGANGYAAMGGNKRRPIYAQRAGRSAIRPTTKAKK